MTEWSGRFGAQSWHCRPSRSSDCGRSAWRRRNYILLATVQAEPASGGAELARRLSVPPQAVASLVARLEARGQLERRTHARHQHVQELHLTDSGQESLRAADAEIAAIEQEVREALGADGDQLRELLETVAATAGEMRTRGAESGR